MSGEPLETIALRLRDNDDVVVLKRPLKAGAEFTLGHRTFTAPRTIPAGHKIAVRDLPADSPIRKYGQTIGFASVPIATGDHVHIHNVALRDFARDYAYCADARPLTPHPASSSRTFPGFARPNGSVGTRNYLAIISTVNCSASVSNYVRDHFRTPAFQRDFRNVDGVIAFTHKTGCAYDPGEPQQLLRRVLAGIARHPNIGGYVMIGLGCEVNQLQEVRKQFALDAVRPGDATPIFLNIQSEGGTRKTVEVGIAAAAKLLPQLNAHRRTPQPLGQIILAENCGGSDGNSGITANPALGVASDELVRFGGTSVLAETPEIYGAEHLLTRRAITREVGEKLVELIHWWEAHARLHNATIDNNPSFGNKEGGLTTIYEKSLGAVAKGGQAPLTAVYRYAEPITAKGFCFMDTPGFDPVSMTGLIAGGCNVGVFTTGRGSVYGCKPSPCLKIATNTPLYERMEEDMDINAGTILEGKETVEQVGQRIFERIVSVAGGEKTKSELAGLGDEEFAPWILGPTF